MPVMKKTILYSLFIVSSLHFPLHCQDANMQDSNEDLLLIFDDSSEEVYPLEDVDTVIFSPEIKNCVHDLEFDSAPELENMIENNEQFLPQEIVEVQEIQIPEIMDTALLPIAPEDIMILDSRNMVEQDPSTESQADTIVYQIDENELLKEQSVDADDSGIIDACEECPVLTIEQAQLEDLLSMQCQQMEQYLFDATTVSSPKLGDCQTISIDDEDIVIALNNGINVFNREQATISEDDDIVPVPHDLINSVKKANKQKKKLEKKEKAQLRKSNKKNKKASYKK